jgi:hypothetical protein
MVLSSFLLFSMCALYIIHKFMVHDQTLVFRPRVWMPSAVVMTVTWQHNWLVKEGHSWYLLRDRMAWSKSEVWDSHVVKKRGLPSYYPWITWRRSQQGTRPSGIQGSFRPIVHVCPSRRLALFPACEGLCVKRVSRSRPASHTSWTLACVFLCTHTFLCMCERQVHTKYAAWSLSLSKS